MVQLQFDGGIFLILLAISITSLVLYRKIGVLLLVIPIISFLILGLVVITGEDVTFFKITNQSNMTVIMVNGASTTTTTYHNITPSNSTTYLIGNGQFPITAQDRLALGYLFFVISILLGVIFLDGVLKGRLVLGD